jgi:hypothetical protein
VPYSPFAVGVPKSTEGPVLSRSQSTMARKTKMAQRTMAQTVRNKTVSK